jgi:hypothetical protein
MKASLGCGLRPPLVFGLILGLALDGAALMADDYSFERIFPSFDSLEEANTAEKSAQGDRETALRLGNFFFIAGTAAESSPAMKKAYANKAIDVLERLWKKNRKDNEVCLSLGYAYTARAGITPLSELESLMADIDKAQNLFGMVVARLPKNIDARLARTMINMNLAAQNGRPDALIVEDYAAFMEGYGRLAPGLKANPYYKMGAEEMRLAKALVRADQGKKAEARGLFGDIDPSVLPAQFRALYDALKKRLG